VGIELGALALAVVGFNIGRYIQGKSTAYQDFYLESRRVTHSVTQAKQNNMMEDKMSNLKRSVKSIYYGQQERNLRPA
jgi:hypothetical protein